MLPSIRPIGFETLAQSGWVRRLVVLNAMIINTILSPLRIFILLPLFLPIFRKNLLEKKSKSIASQSRTGKKLAEYELARKEAEKVRNEKKPGLEKERKN